MDRCVLLILALVVTVPVIVMSRPGLHHPSRAAFSVLSSQRMVAVGGDVEHPGIYPFSANAMTGGVIELAVAAEGQAVWMPRGVERVPLRNGAAIHVARNREGRLVVTVGSIPVAQRIVLGIPLDMNAMSEADFEQVPGIGPVLAKRIVEYRQLNGGLLRKGDLLSIEGIGKVTYYRLENFF